MSKREILEIYHQLEDNQKQHVAQRINRVMEISVSPRQLQSFLQQHRIFKKDLDTIYGIISEYSKKKKIGSVVEGKPRQEKISSVMTSFLRPSQIGKMTRTSTGAYRTFYQSTAPTLHKIETSRIRHPEQFIKKLHLFTSLKELDLSGVRLTETTSRLLAKALEKLTNLQSVNLHGTQPYGENSLLLLPAISHLKTLKVLDLSLNHYGQEGVDALAKVLPTIKSLQRLVLYDSEIGDQGAIAIANGLRTLRNLRYLDMELNQYGVDGVKAIMSAIERKEHFEELYLGDAMDDECASFIAYGIKTLKNLRVLKIDNAIGDEGAYFISQSFRFTPRLEKLSMSEFLGPNMSIWITNLKYVPHLKELNLAVNEIGSESIQGLVAAFPNLPELRVLTLHNNKLTNQGIITLAENIHLLRRLNRLDVSTTDCGNDGAHSLTMALAPMIGKIEKINIKNNNLSDAVKNSLQWLFEDKIEI